MTTTTIDSVFVLPSSPYNGSGMVGVIITSGIATYYKITGANLDQIVSVNWYPNNPTSVLFSVRKVILVDSTNTLATFAITVKDNYLNMNDRGGYIGFTISDGTNIVFPVITYGPVSLGPLWTAPDQGLITGS